MNDIRDVRRSMEGVKRAYFCPPFAPYSHFTGMTFVVAAEEMKLEHVALMTQWFSANAHASIGMREHWLTDQIAKLSPNVEYITVNPSYAFDFIYFMSLELMAQMGIMPDMGRNAPPSSEDIGVVVAHTLKDPEPYEGNSYRPTGPKTLSGQEMVDIIGDILERKVTAQKMSKEMLIKSLKADGLPIYAYSQIPYYNKEAFDGTMEVSGPTDVVKQIVGREPEDFRTITRRFITGNPVAKQTLGNKLRALKNLVKVMLSSVPDLEAYHRKQGHPQLAATESCQENQEWLMEHESPTPKSWVTL